MEGTAAVAGGAGRPTGSPAPRAVIVVEGVSDQRAVEALAARRGRDLAGDGVAVLPAGGARGVARLLRQLGPLGLGIRLAGLYDAAEEPDVRRALERAGIGAGLSRPAMERLGFHVCVADLEDELIRALGAAAVEQVLDGQGELGAFRVFQRQPAWLGRTVTEQLRRFLGTHGGRKIRTAPRLVEALDLDRVPPPLDAVLARV